MKGHLQAALFGVDRPRSLVDRCTPTRPLYNPGESCVLRYQFQARDPTSGTVVDPIVIGRVFPDHTASATYMREKLAPLAERMRNRPEVAAFTTPAATIDALNMVVHVWPIDGELPTLVDATDPRRMIEVFSDTLAEALDRRLRVEDCQIELVSYRRRQRCVLRYTVAGSGDLGRLVVYGKVTGFSDQTLKSQLINVLRERIRQSTADVRLTIPRPLGGRPDLQLLLLEALPGEASIGPALKAGLRGQLEPRRLWLETLIAACGQVVAMVHASGVFQGNPRTLDDELIGLRQQIAAVRQFVPSFGDRAQSWLQRIAALAERTDPLKLCLSHGDFKHEQLLFDGADAGLVDFDALCQAEPALDLGKFLAHLRVEVMKVQGGIVHASHLREELAEQFVRAYVGAAGGNAEDEGQLRARTMLYEAVALLRLALRGQQDLDEGRAAMTSALLEERVSAAELEH